MARRIPSGFLDCARPDREIACTPATLPASHALRRGCAQFTSRWEAGGRWKWRASQRPGLIGRSSPRAPASSEPGAQRPESPTDPFLAALEKRSRSVLGLIDHSAFRSNDATLAPTFPRRENEPQPTPSPTQPRSTHRAAPGLPESQWMR